MTSRADPVFGESERVGFSYAGRRYSFHCWSRSDHVLRLMKRRETFYEIDVLERVKSRLDKSARSGAAIDAGAFIGTHAIYFGSVCGLAPVLAFEPHPRSFSLLEENVRINDLDDKVVPIQKALSSRDGSAILVEGQENNKGKSSINLYPAAVAEARVTTCSLDSYLDQHPAGHISLIKIDVEGGEVDVLEGAKRTIARCAPILCIEAHTAGRLRTILSVLKNGSYLPVDCRGWSPTYVLEPTRAGPLGRLLARQAWLVRARLPRRFVKLKETLRRVARRAARLPV